MTRTILVATTALAVLLCGGTAAAGSAIGAAPPAAGGFVAPVSGARITQGFGCTAFPFEPHDAACPERHWHSGIDLAAALGTPVHATRAGIVTVLVSTTGYGLHVVIDHGGGLTSLYGHLSEVAVSSGDHVMTGALVGAVGSSGNSTGPHLHFEIRRDGVPEDPLLDVRLP